MKNLEPTTCPWCNTVVTPIATDERAVFVHSKGTAKDRVRNPLMCPDCFGVGGVEDWYGDPGDYDIYEELLGGAQ